MCGIFGYINYLVEKDRKTILDSESRLRVRHLWTYRTMTDR